MRGVALILIGILLLAIPFQTAIAHHQHENETGNFELQAFPTKLTTHQGGAVSSMISLQVEDESKLSGKVQLSLSWDNRIPQDAAFSFSPASIGADESSNLTFTTRSDSTIGNFHFHVYGSIGAETESIRMALKIKNAHIHGELTPDYAISADPLNLTATQGKNASSTVYVSSINGFNDSVGLSITWTASTPANVSAILQPHQVTPSATSNLTLTTGVNTAVGVYNFRIIGISSDLVHASPPMHLNVTSSSSPPPPPPPPPAQADFTMKIKPDAWTIHAGETAIYNITLTPLNSFSNTVAVSVSPSYLQNATIFLSSNTVSLPTMIQLHIATETNLTANTYAFTITGTGGGQTHSSELYLMALPSEASQQQVQLNLQLSSQSIPLGSSVTISGKFTPSQGFGSVPVYILYTNTSSIQWNQLARTQTDSSASLSKDWTPSAAGTYGIMALWNGDSTHNAIVSNTVILTVTHSQTQPTTEFPWFWLVIAAIVIIGAATAITLRMRKKPVTTPVP